MIGIFVLLLGGVGFISHKQNKIIDCNSLSPIYLKPSELSSASKIANDLNVVVVVPEINQLSARTDVLDCPNFNYKNYVRVN